LQKEFSYFDTNYNHYPIMNPFLHDLTTIRNLPRELYRQLDEQTERQEVKKGDLLKKAGEECDRLYFVGKGVARGYKYAPDGEVTFWFKKESQFILQPELIVSNDETNNALEIQMLEDGTLWVLPGTAVTRLVQEFLAFNYHLMHIIMREALLVRERVMMERQQDPTLKYDHLRGHEPELLGRVPAAYLASYIGISEKQFHHLRKSALHLPLSSKRHYPRKKRS
jgi:CRP-like cAMP-binding protein